MSLFQRTWHFQLFRPSMTAFSAPVIFSPQSISFHPILVLPYGSYLCQRRSTTRTFSVFPNQSRQLEPFQSVTMQGGNDPTPQKGEAPDGSTLTHALEISFRSVWLRLLTSGIGKEYDDAITAFIIATMAAYKAGYSISALKFELAAHERTTEYNGVNVSLTDGEKQTRLIWISLIYLTLASTKLSSERPVIPVLEDIKGTTLESFSSGLADLVASIREADRKGYNLETFKMEIALHQGGPNSTNERSEEEIGKLRAQASIRSQWSRIVFRTLAILPNDLKREV